MWISLSGLAIFAALFLAVVVFIIHSVVDLIRGRAKKIWTNLGALIICFIIISFFSDAYLDKHEKTLVLIVAVAYGVPNYLMRNYKFPKADQM
jgi:TctA family transporter